MKTLEQLITDAKKEFEEKFIPKYPHSGFEPLPGITGNIFDVWLFIEQKMKEAAELAGNSGEVEKCEHRFIGDNRIYDRCGYCLKTEDQIIYEEKQGTVTSKKVVQNLTPPITPLTLEGHANTCHPDQKADPVEGFQLNKPSTGK